ncbi:hypothetical protein [Fuscibacter oryzae]|uniref:Uncharacterized protein n=1 Tax=Fuscibacter oryzae TaxID=2803939 RepID=A0A8J7STF2_9RHOB|nr:hypothetical protein [Fuscibacter oryzae]MBL4927452.1 hypothetical protein [Fuscibacter oryzae]
MLRLALVAVLSALPIAALADGKAPEAFTLKYEMFEQGIAHVDLQVCPEPLQAPGRFCRATLINGMINVFAFDEKGDQPLVGFQSWNAALLDGLLD